MSTDWMDPKVGQSLDGLSFKDQTLLFMILNSPLDIINGKVQYHQNLAPYTQAEDILNILEFDPSMLETALGGGE